jgi:hypothetical protein
VPAQEQEGYRLTGSQVVVDQPAHWQRWQGATGTYQLHPDGSVQPYFLRRQTNAVLDASHFETIIAEGDTVRGGLRAAGSNAQTAALALDGDVRTFWEPDPKDSLEQWFVEIDLGRSVIAQQVRVLTRSPQRRAPAPATGPGPAPGGPGFCRDLARGRGATRGGGGVRLGAMI